MRFFFSSSLLIAAGMVGMTAIAAHAQHRTITECVQKLTARGFNVIDKDIDDGLYEFEAIKNKKVGCKDGPTMQRLIRANLQLIFALKSDSYKR